MLVSVLIDMRGWKGYCAKVSLIRYDVIPDKVAIPETIPESIAAMHLIPE